MPRGRKQNPEPEVVSQPKEPLCSECHEPLRKRNPECQYCRICTPEENRAGFAALRAAIYGKPGPIAKVVEAVCRRMNGEDEAF